MRLPLPPALSVLLVVLPGSLHLTVHERAHQDNPDLYPPTPGMPLLPAASIEETVEPTNCKKSPPQGLDTQERLAGSYTAADDVATSVDDGFEPLSGSFHVGDMPAKDLDPENLKTFVSKEIVWKPPIKEAPMPVEKEGPLYVPRFDADIKVVSASGHGTSRLEGRLYVDQIKGMMKYVMESGTGGYFVKLLFCGLDGGTLYTYTARSSKVAEECKYYKMKCSDDGLLPLMRVAPTAKLVQESEEVLPSKNRFIDRAFKADHWKFIQNIQMPAFEAPLQLIAEDWVEAVPQGFVPAKVERSLVETQNDEGNARVVYKKSVIFSQVVVHNHTMWDDYVIPPKSFTSKEAAEKFDTKNDNTDEDTANDGSYHRQDTNDVRVRTCSGPHSPKSLQQADIHGRPRKYISHELKVLDQLLLL